MVTKMFDWLFGKSPKEKSATSKELPVRLTDAQKDCLLCASTEHAIYGENPSHRYAQTPNGSRTHNQRTIDSMVKKGLLSSNSKGGYLLTQKGAALRRSENW